MSAATDRELTIAFGEQADDLGDFLSTLRADKTAWCQAILHRKIGCD